MGISDRLEKEMGRKRVTSTDLVEGMSEAVATLLEQGMFRIKNGEMKIEDPNDLIRLWAVMEKTTDYIDVIENRDSASTGALPALSTKEASVFGVDQHEASEGEIITDDVPEEELSGIDMDNMLQNLEEAMNADNVISMDKD